MLPSRIARAIAEGLFKSADSLHRLDKTAQEVEPIIRAVAQTVEQVADELDNLEHQTKAGK